VFMTFIMLISWLNSGKGYVMFFFEASVREAVSIIFIAYS